MINFKANLALQTEVKQLYKKDSYTRVPATFVKLDINSLDDYLALRNVSQDWKDGDLYAIDVFNRFKENFEEKPENPVESFFVLTKQRKNLNKLDFSKILGVAELYQPTGGPIEIEFLQTNPAFLDTLELPAIKHVGKAMIESFKKIFKDREIALFSTPDAISFYKKLGFKNIESNLMVLKR